MKRAVKGRVVCEAALLAAIVLLIAVGMLFANGFHLSIQNGETIDADALMTRVFRIRAGGVEKAGDRSVLTLRINGEADLSRVALAAFRSKSIVLFGASGEEYTSSGTDTYRHMRLLQLDGRAYDVQNGTLRLEWRVDDFFNPTYLFIGSSEALQTQSTLWGRIRDVSVGIMLLMLVYSVSLFANKREERYLSSFAVYIAMSLLMTLLNMGFFQSGWLYGVYSECVPFLIMVILCVEVSTVCRLLDVRGRWWTRLFCSWRWVLCLSLLYFGLSRLNVMLLKEISRFAVILAGFAAVVVARAERKPNALIIFMGFAVSEAINLVPMGINLGFYEDGLTLALFRTGRLYSLPFAFSCMFFINRKFASRFKETERLSAQLEETNRTLDQTVQERTKAALSQVEKRHSMMLNIFHDLRSPLFILKGCLQILFDENENNPDEREETQQIVLEKLSDMSELTENLFLLAKLEDDQFVLSCARLNLRALVKKLADAYRLAAERKGIGFAQTLQRGDACVWGDALRLKSAFGNILDNAVRYTPSGGQITVRMSWEAGVATVEISDTGMGIAPENLQTIFDRYYSANPTAKTSSGLGLAIAQGIIKKHNGSIEAQSVPGEGAVFTVTLPLLEKQAKEGRA